MRLEVILFNRLDEMTSQSQTIWSLSSAQLETEKWDVGRVYFTAPAEMNRSKVKLNIRCRTVRLGSTIVNGR